MPIADSDIRFRLAAPSAPAGDVDPQADPDASLGGQVSTTALSGIPRNNLFDDVTGDENATGVVEYRCLFVHNAHPSLTLTSAVVWLSATASGGAAVAIGVDPTPASPADDDAPQAVAVANERAAPAGVAFSAPTSKGSGLSLGDLGPGECRAVWLRRTAADTPPANADGVSVRVEGDTLDNPQSFFLSAFFPAPYFPPTYFPAEL